MNVTPISPDDISKVVPDEVIESFNLLIQRGWDGTKSKVKQSDAVDEISRRLDISKLDVFDKRYLDVESIYTKAGWEVRYKKPAYNENEFPPYFIFEKP